MVTAVCLNVNKCRKWVTKGINLSIKNPAALVPPGLEQEFHDYINQSISDEQIFAIDPEQVDGLVMENVGSFDAPLDMDGEIHTIEWEDITEWDEEAQKHLVVGRRLKLKGDSEQTVDSAPDQPRRVILSDVEEGD